jgi:hypothetical protein
MMINIHQETKKGASNMHATREAELSRAPWLRYDTPVPEEVYDTLTQAELWVARHHDARKEA